MISYQRKGFFIKLLIFQVIFVMCILSCSSQNDKSITFLHFFSGHDEKETINKIIKEIEDNNDFKVSLIQYDLSKGPNELIAILRKNQKIDVIAYNSAWISQLHNNRILLDSLEVLNDSIFYNILTEYCKFNGKINSLPWLVNTKLLFVNQKITGENKIDKLPIDFQTLLDFSERINEKGKYYGIGLVGINKRELLKNIIPFILSFGGNFEDNKGELHINNYLSSAGIYFYLKLSSNGLLETKREIENQFIKGNIAYCFSDLSLLHKIIKQNNSNNFIALQIPQYGKKHVQSHSDAVLLGICSNSENKELSVKFIKELVNWKFSNKYAIDLLKYGVPAIKEFNLDLDYYITNKIVKKNINFVIKKQISNSILIPKHPRWYDIESIMESEIEKVIYSEKSVEGSINDANEEISNLIKKIK